MKKLFVTFRDGSKVTYTMENKINHLEYINKHSKLFIKTAILQKYPKSKNEAEVLIQIA